MTTAAISQATLPNAGQEAPGASLPVWRDAALAMLPALLAIVWLVAKVRWVWTNRPEMQFGWIVALLSAYLVWENWERRPALRLRPGWLNLAMSGAGVVVLALVQVYQAAFGTNAASLCGHAIGTSLIVGANLHFAFGPAGWAVFGFPFLFLLVAMPLPSAILNPVTHGLQNFITAFNVEFLNLIGVPAERIGSLIRLPSGTVGVDEACSGIRSLQSSIMATLFIGYLTLKSNLLRMLLFAGGMAVAVIGNVLRSFYLSFTANSQGVASVDRVHDAAGWSILLFTAAGVALLAWFLLRVERAAARAIPPTRSRDNAAAQV